MKHEKEWYTCDRCGREIETVPSTAGGWIHKVHRILCPPTDLHTLTADRDGYILRTEFLKEPEVMGVDIEEYYHSQYGTIHLCGKCRKAFERFLRNEN